MAVVQPPASGTTTAPPWQVLGSLLHELPGLVSDRVYLLSLEIKRAGIATAHIVALTLGAAILLATAWLALWAGVIVGLMQNGVHWAWVFGGVLLVNGGAAAWALLRVKQLAPLLGLPATLRHLTLAREPAPPPSSAGAASLAAAPTSVGQNGAFAGASATPTARSSEALATFVTGAHG